jgi:hypothetical protein
MRERGRMPHNQGQGFCDLLLAVDGKSFLTPCHWQITPLVTLYAAYSSFVGGGVVGDISTAAYSWGVTELLDPQPSPNPG